VNRGSELLGGSASSGEGPDIGDYIVTFVNDHAGYHIDAAVLIITEALPDKMLEGGERASLD
jgi:hypothetical protein